MKNSKLLAVASHAFGLAAGSVLVILFPHILLAAANQDDAAFKSLNFGSSTDAKNQSTPQTGTERKQKNSLSRGKGDLSKNKKKTPAPELPTAVRAEDELKAKPQDVSPQPSDAAGTVRGGTEPVKNPNRRPAYDLGVTIQPYQPAGTVKLPGINAYQLDSLGSRPMVAVEFHWLPVHFVSLTSGNFSAGIFTSVGYSDHPVSLTTPTGQTFSDAALQTFKLAGGGSLAWHPAPLPQWALRGEVGGGEMRAVQSSSASIANQSGASSFASLGLYAERRIEKRFAVFLGYDYRLPIGGTADVIEIQRSNFILGISGGFGDDVGKGISE